MKCHGCDTPLYGIDRREQLDGLCICCRLGGEDGCGIHRVTKLETDLYVLISFIKIALHNLDRHLTNGVL
jgi:hypothetical protein